MSMTLPAADLVITCSGSDIGALSGSFSKKLEMMSLQYLVSITGSHLRMGASLATFFREMKICFCCNLAIIFCFCIVVGGGTHTASHDGSIGPAFQCSGGTTTGDKHFFDVQDGFPQIIACC